MTASVPEIVEALHALPAQELILDGEAVALAADGSPQPFQITMRRFGRKLDVERMRAELPLAVYFFDCLYVDDASLLDRPAHERFDALAAALPAKLVIPRIVTADVFGTGKAAFRHRRSVLSHWAPTHACAVPGAAK